MKLELDRTNQEGEQDQIVDVEDPSGPAQPENPEVLRTQLLRLGQKRVMRPDVMVPWGSRSQFRAHPTRHPYLLQSSALPAYRGLVRALSYAIRGFLVPAGSR